MPVNLSIKNVPDDLAERLRDRAKRSHRSLQGELMVILEEVVRDRGRMSPIDVLGVVRSLGVKTGDDAVALACETALTANDASYLWLARELRANHLTLDHALDSAWRTS